MRFRTFLQNIIRSLVEHRILLALGLGAASGIVLNTLYPINEANSLLRLIAYQRPPVFHGLVWSYGLFLYPRGRRKLERADCLVVSEK